MSARRLGWVGLAVALLGAQVWADEGARSARVPLLPKYTQECAACHIAYPPGLMPAASWQRVTANLPRHYGTDALLDPATVSALADWLTANAARDGRRSEPPPDDRITRSAWFIRKHREVAAATWKLPSVRSAANCAACHTQADQGDFNEHHVRIPR
ncbi:Dihaem cytochrome c [Variovorax sp. HW608]|uniref:diheme cytochrome c n=1 Tax=Variovorax sp. HW608 TaxID=1034889 RepID=UPI00081F77F0|nr:diheme cytochrome c [Variovorax sp. HW608]SCK50994.1 Dihaem cytochrome c [Variovorax sp. HW608]